MLAQAPQPVRYNTRRTYPMQPSGLRTGRAMAWNARNKPPKQGRTRVPKVCSHAATWYSILQRRMPSVAAACGRECSVPTVVANVGSRLRNAAVAGQLGGARARPRDRQAQAGDAPLGTVGYTCLRRMATLGTAHALPMHPSPPRGRVPHTYRSALHPTLRVRARLSTLGTAVRARDET